jgi:hypothetical protein
MRLSLRIAAVAAAFLAFDATANNASAQEYIVSSQIVSDEAVGSAVQNGYVDGGYVETVDGGIVGGARTYGQPNLFHNYYTQGYSNQVNAQMYVSPLPVPPYVGHTFMTYPPLAPEHYLYTHKDRYHNHYDGGRGLNRTRAIYTPSAKSTAKSLYWNFLRIPR